MAFDAHLNLVYSTVAAAPSPAISGTSLTLAAGASSWLPAVPFNATVWPAGVQALNTNAEIVRVTAKAGDVLTITRVAEDLSSKAIAVGWQFAATITAKTLQDVEGPVDDARLSINVLRHSGGYPGGTTAFLRADGSFAAPVVSGGGDVYTYVANVFTQDQLITKTRPDLQLLPLGDTHKGHVFALSAAEGGGVFLSNNLWYNGANWMRDNTARSGSSLDLTGNGVFIYSAPGGANPATLTEILRVDAMGNLSFAGNLVGGSVPDARLSANVALKNIDNNFVAQSLATGTAIRGANAALYFHDTAGLANAHYFSIVESGGFVYFQMLDDAISGQATPLQLSRDGSLLLTGPEIRTLGTSNYCRLHLRASGYPAGAQTFVLLNYQQNLYIVPASDDGLAWGPGVTGWEGGLVMGRAGQVSLGSTLIVNGSMSCGGQVYPGRFDVAGGAVQTAWFLASHGSYGLYTNTGLKVTNAVYANVLALDGAGVAAPAGGVQCTALEAAPYHIRAGAGLYAGTDVYAGTGIFEAGRGARAGWWTDYTPTVTCDAGTAAIVAQYACRYSLIGKTVHIAFYLWVDTGGAALTWYALTLPAGLTASNHGGEPFAFWCNSFAGAGCAATIVNDTRIFFTRDAGQALQWSINRYYIRGSLTIPVN